MPDITQQEWLEKWLEIYLLRNEAATIAGSLASAWPSSPQGLAVKQVVETLERVKPLLKMQSDIWAMRDALDAARKAGLA